MVIDLASLSAIPEADETESLHRVTVARLNYDVNLTITRLVSVTPSVCISLSMRALQQLLLFFRLTPRILPLLHGSATFTRLNIELS